jgi:hypothetical protein
MMTRSPGGSCCLWRRKNSRNRRFTRLRRTAFPRRRVTANPRRAAPVGPGPTTMPKCRVWSRRPWAWARRKSARRRIRSALLKRAVPLAVGGLAEHRLGVVGVRLRRLPPLDREAGPALGPTALQNPAAALAAHPLQKAVGSGPAQIMGLIGTFHSTILNPRTFSNHFINHLSRSLSREGRRICGFAPFPRPHVFRAPLFNLGRKGLSGFLA